MVPHDDTLNVRETAALLGIDTVAVYLMIDAGDLPVQRRSNGDDRKGLMRVPRSAALDLRRPHAE